MWYYYIMKSTRQLERYCKGVANHRRLEILFLTNRRDGITLDGIAQALECNMKTISEHTRRLVQAGLLNKKYQGREVIHSLSPYGRKFIDFMRSF